MPNLPVQVAFQGGGAKLGTLIAAARALYEDNNRKFEVTRVAGTSAGAIAAAIFASGRDPSVFSARLREISPKYLKLIAPKKWKLLSAVDLLRGNALYNIKEYKCFLRDLFLIDGQQITRIDELEGVKDIFFYSTDIRTKRPVVYSKDSREILLVDALFNSSALPYIFSSFKDDSGLIDGGIINNFPSNILNEEEKYGKVIGFSFPRSKFQMSHPDIRSYSGALVETMMENAIDLALARLDSRNVHTIQTKTSTLDFAGAIERDLGSEFLHYVNDVKQFLDRTTKRMRLERVGVLDADAVNRIEQYYQSISENDNIEVPIVKVTYRCNALRERDPEKLDECQIEIELKAIDKPARSFSLQIAVASNSLHEKAKDIEINVIDDADNLVGATIIPTKAEISESGVPAAKLIILFHNDLEVGRHYKLSFAADTSEVLYDLISQERTDFARFSLNIVDKVQKLLMLAYVPREFSNIELVDWKAPYEGEVWIEGNALTKAELARISCPPNGFYAIGWTAENLSRGNATGFQAFLR